MALKDPANLLQRIPELESLAADPAICRAIESGDSFKVYRALVWAKWLKRLPAHQETLKTLVRHRRLFAKPLNGSPALATFNSIGFGFVGSSEKDTDGSYIAMHAIVVLYLIPVIPLRSYLVQKTGSSGFSSEWRIFARVPASLFGWMYTRGLALMLVGLVAWGAVDGLIKSRTQDIVVLNGLDLPVEVELDGTKKTIRPMRPETIQVNVGEVQGSATARGITIDTLRRNVASSSGHTIWNIAGAAPVFQERVSYSKDKTGVKDDTAPTVYCGQQFIEVAEVDDVFSDPPSSVKTGRHTDKVYRTHLGLASTDKAGYMSCLYYLAAHDRARDAKRFLEIEAIFKDWDGEATAMAMFAAALASPADAIRIARQALQVHPDDILLHRRYQAIRDDAGQEKELAQEYAEMARRQPDSATAQYLSAMLVRGRAGVAALDKLAQRYSQDPNILRSLAWRRMVHGDYAGTMADWRRLQALSPAEAARVADAQVRALVASRRAPEAAALLASLLSDPKDEDRAEHAAEYLMVTGLTGADPRPQAERLGKDAGGDAMLDPVRVRAGMDPVAEAAEQSPLVRLMLALRSDPAAAVRLAGGMSQAEFSQLGPEQWGLLFAEAVRSKQAAVIAKLERSNPMASHADRVMLKRFVQGEAVTLDEVDIEPGFRAAAMLVRSRNTTLPAEERARWRASALQSDLLRSVVSTALAKWPV